MAEIQLVPTAFNPPTEQQQAPNAGLANGGTATDIRNPDAVVQSVTDVIDLDNGANNDAEQYQDRQASLGVEASGDVQVRVDFDPVDSQLYLDFVDPRTEVALVSIPPRSDFDFDPAAIRRQASEDTDEAAPAPVQDLPLPVEEEVAIATVRVSDTERLLSENRAIAAREVPVVDDTAGAVRVQAQITADVVEQSFVARQEVQTATNEQRGILENA